MSGRQVSDVMDSHLSRERRQFIIISVFDATLIFLLWLICTVTKSDNWREAFLHEIDITDPLFFTKSLFDVLIIAVCRMIILLVVYAICVVHHWLPVAVTTSVSTILIVLKVLFFFSKSQNGVPQYLLVLSSFFVSWYELWLMQSKVLKHERQVLYGRLEDNVSVQSGHANGHPPVMNGSAAVRSTMRMSEDDFHTVGEFSSDEESRVAAQLRMKNETYDKIPAMLRERYEKALHDAEIRAEVLLRQAKSVSEEWKIVRQGEPMVKRGPDGYFYVRAELQCTPLMLFNAMFNEMGKWNKLVLQAKSVCKLSANTDLFYTVTAPALRGYVASRDFIDVRRSNLNVNDQVYTGIFVSIESSLFPPGNDKKLVRGSNGASMIRTTQGLVNSTAVFEWVLKNELRGGLPKRLVASSMLNYFIEHYQTLKPYIEAQEEHILSEQH